MGVDVKRMKQEVETTRLPLLVTARVQIGSGPANRSTTATIPS